MTKRSQEGKKAGGQAIIGGQSPRKNNFLSCIRKLKRVFSPREIVRERADSGRLEDRKVGGYAEIGEQSSQNTCHCEGVERPSQSQNIIEPHPNPLFRPLPQYLLNFKIFEQEFSKERQNTFSKRTYSPIDLLTYSLKSITLPLNSPPLKGGDMERVQLIPAFTLAECATRVAMPNGQRQAAFTLAEVLITLGIIGVVAAMTLPVVITNYKRHVLETQFKKAYSLIQNAHLLMQNDYPMLYEDLNSESDMRTAYSNHLDKLIKYIPNAQLCTKYYLDCTGRREKSYDSFVKGTYAHIDADSLTQKSILTNSGILIFMSPWGARGYHIDINGPAKGPNRLGHDLFSFNIDKNNNVVPYTRFGGCFTSEKEHYQGFTCAKWAILNTCETDTSKTYWQCINP